MEFQQVLEEWRQESQGPAWEGTFAEYLAMVTDNPRLARSSHARLHHMIQAHGTIPGPKGVPRHNLFAHNIFGLDPVLDRLVRFFHAASMGLEPRKRGLLLVGPPASGKSSIVELLKQGMERYSRTPEGAIYAIRGCPMQEEPLHLVPREQREQLAREYGLHVEGELCPRCRYSLRNDYSGDISRVMVRRTLLSQAEGVGMGSFVATTLQDQDLSRLVGSVDVSRFGDDRREGTGRAFRLEGELEAANRGIMEFGQILGCDGRVLNVLLGLTQEQVIKLESFGSVSADEVVIGHSSVDEYDTFLSNSQAEALLDRLIVVRIPYLLQVTEEVKIHRKLLAGSLDGGVHVAPLSLPVVAALSVLTRLAPVPRSGGLRRPRLLDKLKMYDGLVLPPYTSADVDRLQDEDLHEGLSGMSPRYVVNRLADVLAQETTCLRPLDVLNSLAEGLEEWAGLRPGERKRLPSLLKEALNYYRELAVRQVRRATVEDLHVQAGELFEAYIVNARIYLEPQEGEESQPPDERLLRRVERAIEVKDGESAEFRRQAIGDHDQLLEQGQTPTYSFIPALGWAIEELLLPGLSETRHAMGAVAADPEADQKRAEVEGRLVEEYGYCEVCARDIYKFTAALLQGEKPATLRGHRLSLA